MTELLEQISEATASIRSQWSRKPRAGLILGTGLDTLAKEVAADVVLPY
ncbi:MAG: purine-nucleoside phosphorylase, partial [Planctomycetaceae bacterium]|nr:purine-nucleoside phosphorylase [Planctomycetaceae bacterium]